MSHLQTYDLERLSAGEVTAIEQQQFENHLSQCGQCRDYFEELEADHKELMVLLPPSTFASRVLAEHKGEQRLFENPVWLRLRTHRIAAATAGAIIVVGALGLVFNGASTTEEAQPSSAQNIEVSTTQALLIQIVRAGGDNQSGVEVRHQGSNRFTPASAEQLIEPGATLRTDSRTRARIQLSDGTSLVLNHSTAITLDPHQQRRILLSAGELMAEVVPLQAGPAAQFDTPSGRVDVLGTKLLLTATDDITSVRVTRGRVRLSGSDGQEAEVKAGEEGLLEKDRGISVSSALDLAGDLAWTEILSTEEEVENTATGLGELRARRPGHDEERERPLLLASHVARIRIQGNIARTEVEEVFRNESDVTLEGIYRFPLPADARIARLALDVDGRMEDGAFVERGVASKIWTGVIRAATKRNKRRQQEEFIWVPGPWRDPALLEWQRGGRFELRVFPIKARSERRVIIGYTQTIRPHGKGRRYVYPLAHSADASSRVGQFEVDIRVAGTDPSAPVTAHGYDMDTSQHDGVTHLKLQQQSFYPAGDVIVDYALPDPDRELRWWTYAGQGSFAPPPPSAPGNSKSRSTPEVDTARRALAQDKRPFVAFAIRPELPAHREGQSQDYVIVVDSSHSMVGERYARASSLISHLVSEMDRRDRFVLMACDATCQTMEGGLQHPSIRSSQASREWLSQRRPAGASNLVATLREAATALSSERDPDRRVRVLYVGDGMSTIGHRRAGAIATQTEAIIAHENLRISTVGIGTDSDSLILEAVARSGGGHYVPFVPGQRSSAAALAVLETTYGVSLQEATIELPEGITDIAPGQGGRLPTIRAGEELIVTGRFSGETRGELILRGTVGGQPYENRYPIHLRPSSSLGNAFVPRLWADATIERLDLDGQGSNRAQAVALSQSFGVMSRDTSLLVLESEAMFQAFGIERQQHAPLWSGEDEMDQGESDRTMQKQLARVGYASEFPGTERPRTKSLPSGDRRVNFDRDANGGPTLRRRSRASRGQSTVAIGSLQSSAIRSTFQRNASKIRSIYETFLRSNSDIGDTRIAVQCTIGQNGRVTDARLQSSGRNPELGQRIVTVVRTFRFPPMPNGPVIVTMPFIFAPSRSGDGSSSTPTTPPSVTATPQPTTEDPAPDDEEMSPPDQSRLAIQTAPAADIQTDIITLEVPEVRSGRRGNGQWMRRISERVAQITSSDTTWESERRAVEHAEEALRQAPDSRDRHRELVRALARTGELDRGQDVAEQWITRDQLDPEALTALSDILARQGHRGVAVRLLSGVVDLQPDNIELHRQLTAAFDRAGQLDRACAHRVAIAELEGGDDAIEAAGHAIRCARSLGRTQTVSILLDSLQNDEERREAEHVATQNPTARVRGDLMIDADWQGGEDIDVSLINHQGRRISWMGGRRNVVGESSSSHDQERLGIRWTPAGTYIVEVTRTSPDATGTVTGRLRIRALGEHRTIPFSLTGTRMQVARVQIRREQRLAPAR